MTKNTNRLILALSIMLCAEFSFAEEVTEADPSNLFSQINYLELGYEHHELNIAGAEGGLDILRVEYDWTLGDGMLMVAESGFGATNMDSFGGNDIEGEGVVDTRLRFFHIVNEWNADVESGWQGVGYTIETYIPTGDIFKSTGADTWVVAPGIIGNYKVKEGARLFPILSYVYTTPTDDFEKFTGIDENTGAISIDFYATTQNESGFYTLSHGGYQIGTDNREDSAYVQVRLGWMLNESLTVGIEALANWAEDENGSWGSNEFGAESTIRLFVGNYFF